LLVLHDDVGTFPSPVEAGGFVQIQS